MQLSRALSGKCMFFKLLQFVKDFTEDNTWLNISTDLSEYTEFVASPIIT